MDFRGFKLKQAQNLVSELEKKITSMWRLSDWHILKQQSNIFLSGALHNIRRVFLRW